MIAKKNIKSSQLRNWKNVIAEKFSTFKMSVAYIFNCTGRALKVALGQKLWASIDPPFLPLSVHWVGKSPISTHQVQTTQKIPLNSIIIILCPEP